jgi:excisionase family DNA binding protein
MSRIQTAAAAAILGVTPRTVQNLAKRGELPGAAKIGKVWTFDRAKLLRYIADQVDLTQSRAFSAAKASPRQSCEPPLRASEVEKRYNATMELLLGKPLAAIKRRKPRGGS